MAIDSKQMEESQETGAVRPVSRLPQTMSLRESSRPLGNLQLRIGAVAYLNTKPLIYGLHSQIRAPGTLRLALPSQLALELHRGQLDIGLIPVVEYLRSGGRYGIVSNAAIACLGPVWSVRILFRKEPRDVRSLAIDEGSRSSVALASLLFHQRFGRIPNLIDFPIHAKPEDSGADAILVIGDRAMRPERYRATFLTDWDLGQEWFAETGLPFVFALWTAREPSRATPKLTHLLERCRDEGCRNIETIVATYASDYGLTDQECRDYLTRYLRFHFSVDEQAGLEEFSSRCRSLGLV
jgi:chorismate dehydratase